MKYFILKILVIILSLSKYVAGQEGTDCLGKAFHCVNSTHFLICVDFGYGVSVTVDNFAIPCPPSTSCRHQNKFECELEPTKYFTPMSATTKNNASETVPPTSHNTEQLWEVAVNNATVPPPSHKTEQLWEVAVNNATVPPTSHNTEQLWEVAVNNATVPPTSHNTEQLWEVAVNNATVPPTSHDTEQLWEVAVNNATVPPTSHDTEQLWEVAVHNATVPPTSHNTEKLWEVAVNNTDALIFQFDNVISSTVTVEKEALTESNNSSTRDVKPALTFSPESAGITSTSQTSTYSPSKVSYLVNHTVLSELEWTTPIISIALNKSSNIGDGINTSSKITPPNAITLTTTPNAIQIETFTAASLYNLNESESKLISLVPLSTENFVSSVSDSLQVTNNEWSVSQGPSANRTEIAATTTNPLSLQYINQESGTTHGVIKTGHYTTLKPNVLTTAASKSTNQTFVNIIPELSANQVTTSSNGIEISTTEPSSLQPITSIVIDTQNKSTLKTNISNILASIFINQTKPNSSTNTVSTSTTGIEIPTINPSTIHYFTQERITPAATETQNYSTLILNVPTIAAANPMKETSVNLTFASSANKLPTRSSEIKISTTDPLPLRYITQVSRITHGAIETEDYDNLKPNVTTKTTSISMNMTSANITYELSTSQVETSSRGIEISTIDPPIAQNITQDGSNLPAVFEAQNYSSFKPNVLTTAAATSITNMTVNITNNTSANEVPTSSSGIEISTTNTPPLQYVEESRLTHGIIETEDYNKWKPNDSTTVTSTLMDLKSTIMMSEFSANQVTTSFSRIEISKTDPSTLKQSAREVQEPTVNKTQNDSIFKPNISTTAAATSINEMSVNITHESLAHEVPTSSSEIKISTTYSPPLQYITQVSRITYGVIETEDYNYWKPNDSTTAASILMDLKSTNMTSEFSENEVTTSFNGFAISNREPSTFQHINRELRETTLSETQNYSTSTSNVATTTASISTNLISPNITYELSKIQVETSSSGIEISTTDPSTAQNITRGAEIVPVVIETQNYSSFNPNVLNTAAATSMTNMTVNITLNASANEVPTSSSGIEISTTNTPLLQYVQESRTTHGIIETEDYNKWKPNDPTTVPSTLTDLKSFNMSSDLSANQVTSSFSTTDISKMDPFTLEHSAREVRKPIVIETQNHSILKPNISTTAAAATSMNEMSVNITHETSAKEVPTSSSGIKISTTNSPSLQYVTQESSITHGVIETEDYNNLKPNDSTTAASILMDLKSANMTPEFSVNPVTTSFSGIGIFEMNLSTFQNSTREIREPSSSETQNYSTSKSNVSTTSASISMNLTSVNITYKLSPSHVATNFREIEISTTNPSTAQYIIEEVRISPVVIKMQNFSTLKPNVSTKAASISTNQTSIHIIPESLKYQVTTSSSENVSTTDSSPLQYINQESNTMDGVIDTEYHNISEQNYSKTVASTPINQTYVNMITEWLENQASTSYSGSKIYTTDSSALKHSTQELKVTPTVIETENYSTPKPNISTIAASISINPKTLNITSDSLENQVKSTFSGIEIFTTHLSPLQQVTQKSKTKHGIIQQEYYKNPKPNESIITAIPTTQISVNIASQVSANQVSMSSSEIEISTKDPYPLQYILQEARITPAVIETQDYNTLIANFSTTTASIYFNQTSAYITSERPAEQIAPNSKIEKIFNINEREEKLRTTEKVLRSSTVSSKSIHTLSESIQSKSSSNYLPHSTTLNYDSEHIYNITKNNGSKETSQAEITLNSLKCSSVYSDQLMIYNNTIASNNLPNPQPSTTEISKTTIVSSLFLKRAQGNIKMQNNRKNGINHNEVSLLVTQKNNVSSTLDNTSAINDQILNASLKTNFTSKNSEQAILNRTSIPTIIFSEPKVELISLNPKEILNPIPKIIFPKTTTIYPNVGQINKSVATMPSNIVFSERDNVVNVHKEQSLSNRKVVSNTSYSENKIEFKSTAASVTDNYNTITSSMDAFMKAEIDTMNIVVSTESTIHGTSKTSERLPNVDTSSDISKQYLLGLTSPLVPSKSKTTRVFNNFKSTTHIPQTKGTFMFTSTRNSIQNVLKSTSEVAQVSTIPMENINNVLIRNINKHSEIKEQETSGDQNFTCNGKILGRYADLRNPKKFYICVGISKPIIGICPQDAIYVILQNKCYKNATFCEQFHCLKGGRFADPCSRDSYFICHADSSGALVRYKLQCQRGYYVSSSVKCESVKETSQKLLNITIGPKTQSNKINETVVVGICSRDEIYNASTDKCYKIDNPCEQFHCSLIGRFKDPCSSKSYYICQQNSSGALVRYKLQCQSGYEVNSMSIKCTALAQMITNSSKIKQIVKLENKINKSSEEKVNKVTNEKNSDNKDLNTFKEKTLKGVIDRTKYKDVATYLITNKQIEEKIKANEHTNNVNLVKILKVKIQKDKYSSNESSEEKYYKNIKKKQIKREIQSSQSVEKYKFICDTEGNYPYAQDSRKYYECTYNTKRGEFRTRRKSCKNNEVFNGKENECVFNKNKSLKNYSRSNES